jgi:transposase
MSRCWPNWAAAAPPDRSLTARAHGSGPTRSVERRANGRALRANAQRIQLLQTEADQLPAELTVLVGAVAPWLLEVQASAPERRPGAGRWSHAGRFRSEAAFAAVAGTNPIPASSGQLTRYRLNCGGDR